jgi:hypothetical protein
VLALLPVFLEVVFLDLEVVFFDLEEPSLLSEAVSFAEASALSFAELTSALAVSLSLPLVSPQAENAITITNK